MKNSHLCKVIIGVALSTMLLMGCKEKKAPMWSTSILQDEQTLPISSQHFFPFKYLGLVIEAGTKTTEYSYSVD